MRRMNTKIKTVDEYIRTFPKEVATRLKAIRGIIKKAAPKAEEKISYGMAGYKLNGVLIYFAGYAHHIGLYPFPSAIQAFKKELGKYNTSKGTVQFAHDKPLPIPLIRKIVKLRVKERLERKK